MSEEQGLPQAQPAQSFTERKAAQLREERAAQGEVIGDPITPETREPAVRSDVDGISEAVEQDESQGLYAEEVNDQQDLEGSSEALDDESPSDEDQPLEESDHDWEKRYRDLQSETQSIMESRGEMSQEHAEAMSETLRLRFDLEDQITEATKRAEYMRNVMSGNAQQYQNINWSQVPPDKVQEVQAQAQQAMMMSQQAEQAWNQISSQEREVRDQVKQREAAIAKTRLRRTIPNWSNDTYGEIRKFAADQGMPVENFNEITDPVLIEALHAYRQLKGGASTVQQVKTNRKSAAPRGKAARRQPRDERGKYAKARVEPNQRGSFADKHRHRLAMERNGR